MPTFRLDDNEIRAISAFIWQSGVKADLPQQKPGDPAKGKEAFETRGCMACHSMGEGAAEAGRHVQREPEQGRREGELRLHRALGAQSAPALRAVLHLREEGPDRGRLPAQGPALRLRPGAQQVPQRRARAAGAADDADAEPAADRGRSARHRQLPDDAQARQRDLRERGLHGRPEAEESGPRAGAQLRLRGLPRNRRAGRRAAHRNRADEGRLEADRAPGFRAARAQGGGRRTGTPTRASSSTSWRIRRSTTRARRRPSRTG